MEVPKNKKDTETAKKLEHCSTDELELILGELLTWIKDFNWPVAKIVGPILARCDGRILPHVRAVLAGEDDIWKYWTLREVVVHLGKPVRDELMDEVVRIMNSPTPGEKLEEVDLAAGDVMAVYSNEGPC